MRRILIGSIATTLVCLISGCGSSDSNPVGGNGPATINFYNELTNSRAFAAAASVKVDVFTDSSTTAVLTGEGYSTTASGNSATVSVSDGNVNFTVSGSGGGSSVTQGSNAMQDGGTYTTVLMGDLKASGTSTIQIASFAQESATVDSSHVRVRVINTLSLLTDTTVSVVAGTTTISDALDYGTASDYQTVPQSGRTLSIDVAQGGTPITTSCRVQAGNSYDVILAYVNFRGSNMGTLRAADIGIFCHTTP